MKIRPLIIDDELKRAIALVKLHAELHHYIPGETLVPGADPRCRITTQFGYRIVFSYTQTRQGMFRDLSISVDEKGKFPNAFAAYTLADCFGFTGWDQKTIVPPPADWILEKDVDVDAIRIAQLVSK